MKRAGKVRFDYSGDVPFLVVADGDALNFIDYEVGQVTKWPVDDTPLGILIGKSTDLAALGAQIQLNPGGIKDYIGLRAYDPDRPEMGIITVFFQEIDKDTVVLKSWVVEDAQGRITVVELSDPVHNLALADDLWKFKDPRGLAKRRGRR